MPLFLWEREGEGNMEAESEYIVRQVFSWCMIPVDPLKANRIFFSERMKIRFFWFDINIQNPIKHTLCGVSFLAVTFLSHSAPVPRRAISILLYFSVGVNGVFRRSSVCFVLGKWKRPSFFKGEWTFFFFGVLRCRLFETVFRPYNTLFLLPKQTFHGFRKSGSRPERGAPSPIVRGFISPPFQYFLSKT